MVFPGYLALTGAEFSVCPSLPAHPAWMACHLSPSGTGLSNLPKTLPEGAMVILDDAIPVNGHDHTVIAAQMTRCVETFRCSRVLLDFQREGCPETAALAEALVSALPCPVGVAAEYAQDLNCPAFLPPVPLDEPIAQHLTSWQGREVWLEAALDGLIITVTACAAQAQPLPPGVQPNGGSPCPELFCHCLQSIASGQAVFTLYRTAQDLSSLLEQAQALGVTCTVGLYQELVPWLDSRFC